MRKKLMRKTLQQLIVQWRHVADGWDARREKCEPATEGATWAHAGGTAVALRRAADDLEAVLQAAK